ncbi:divergent PAP2 family protein [Bacillus horti]|uniref:Acid phosphatase family membrane protein YuiD n=1 Tax=Caldalkalibacillus horti TaxID=77523 RepID=A0ABT9VTT2_9BACI|nr:divergent PAP2 family protein [Bacillus horti]MDQ0164388.1 acid phosphatase family membrane protein YuiD [Bacillus horti]
MDIFFNIPLLTALLAIGIAQFIKVPLYYIPNKNWNWGLIFSTGGMPSSHSAAVTGLTTGIALEYGVDSPLFAISTVFAIIVMFDAAGVRRHAGEQAVVINRLVDDFNQMLREVKNWNVQTEQMKRIRLKELLGHQPIEVLMGGLLGIGIGIAFHFIVN